MKVLLVCNYRPDSQYSMLSFGDCLAKAIPGAGIQVIKTSPKPVLSAPFLPARLRKWAAYVDKYVLFPKVLRRDVKRADLTHIVDQGNALYVRYCQSTPHLITCHDLLAIRAALGEFENWKVSPTGKKMQRMILAGLKRAQYITADSEATLKDIERLVGHGKDQSGVIHVALLQDLPQVSDPAATWRRHGLDLTPPFFLHVGGDSPYKNRVGAVRIFNELIRLMPASDCKLVLAGRLPDVALRAAIGEVPNGRVLVVDSPSSELLTALYRGAEGLIFPSLNEGFGLPILEAQTLGCPVFTSNRPPMTEVGGAGARYFDPTNVAEAAAIIHQSRCDREAMTIAGFENCRGFSTDRMVRQFVDLYYHLAGADSEGSGARVKLGGR